VRLRFLVVFKGFLGIKTGKTLNPKKPKSPYMLTGVNFPPALPQRSPCLALDEAPLKQVSQQPGAQVVGLQARHHLNLVWRALARAVGTSWSALVLYFTYRTFPLYWTRDSDFFFLKIGKGWHPKLT
jgi:hypothetical protein